MEKAGSGGTIGRCDRICCEPCSMGSHGGEVLRKGGGLSLKLGRCNAREISLMWAGALGRRPRL